MHITHITVNPLVIPLRKPFVTALRTANMTHSVLAVMHTDTGETAYGEAPVVTGVTGETDASITEALLNYIAPAVTGMEIEDLNKISDRIQTAIWGNPSAKYAAECAAYDLCARHYHMPLYRLLGGVKRMPENDITIGAYPFFEDVAAECLSRLGEGFNHFKIKLGKNPNTDGMTLIRLFRSIKEKRPDSSIHFRVDANQGWKRKEAVQIIRLWEDAGIPVEWVEQPVPAWDIDGLRIVTAHTDMPVFADESVFYPNDAVRLLEKRAADGVVIKLAKAGGIRQALATAAVCRAYGVEVVMGCMLESRLGTSYAAHTVSSLMPDIKIDLDGPLLCAEDPFTGGPIFDGPTISLSETEGVGIERA